MVSINLSATSSALDYNPVPVCGVEDDVVHWLAGANVEYFRHYFVLRFCFDVDDSPEALEVAGVDLVYLLIC